MNPNQSSVREGRHVLAIKVTAETPLPPQRVLESTRDFSDRRADVWPNVKAKHLEVHEIGENFADVTEGTWVAGLFWERNHYEWSQPGSVKATVIDSNIFQPGSTWELRATARDSGSEVELVLTPRLPQRSEGPYRQHRPPHRRQMGLGRVSSKRPRRYREADCLDAAHPRQDGRDAAIGAQIHLNNTRRRQRKSLTTGLAHASHTGSP